MPTATAMLRESGLGWDRIIGITPAPTVAALNWQAEAFAMRANADLFRKLLDDERERVNRLQREVNRLKGMWPKGKAV